jgi:hypothetical protein
MMNSGGQMKHTRRFLAIAVLMAALLLTACGKPPEAAQETPAVKVEHLSGSQPSRVTLTAEAAKRLDIQTDSAQAVDVAGAQRVVVPYSSVLYDTEGHTWVYAMTDALTFTRTSVEVDSIDGDDAILQAGPAAGTSVVTVGAEELFGSETEFEEE